ncbi:hypothetical protein K435DRAFT_834392 [Dendrothele bispora CBS 962.96]|uniref:Uncharacterized protein n=1 Tax=Dendrothele bispora (strain CBS 962.96) TaxID=1314807 RepID=A0A4V4HIE0_DENBC|nr:hypothetical protein K435DRAFT_834392 [Dendrothele bispora CBS 962.96]
MNEGLQLHEARYTRNNSGHNNATDSRQCQEHETLRIKPTGISKRSHPSNELPQELTLIMEVNRDIQYKSRRVGNKGNLALQDLVKNIERAIDLARREYLETFRPIIEIQNVDRQLVGLGADFEEFMRHLFGIVQRTHEFTKIQEDRSWISAVLCCDDEDLKMVREYHRQLRKWRRDFNTQTNQRKFEQEDKWRIDNVAPKPAVNTRKTE